MLRTRLLVSAILIPLFIGLCWLDARLGPHALVLLPVALVIAFQCTRELADLLFLSRGSRAGATAGCLLVVLSLWIARIALPADGHFPVPYEILAPLGAALLAYAMVIQAFLLAHTTRFTQSGRHAGRLGKEILCVGYLAVLLVTAASLRWIGGGELGYLALGSLVIGAKIGDVGGYSFGRLFGKRKLAPRISPGKTRAGAVGAVLTAAVGTALWIRWAGPRFDPEGTAGSWPHLLLFGAVLGTVGLIGDLAESLLKRDADMKDASHLMPAFGGLLDLLDSVLYAAPVALLFWLLWPPFE